MFVAVHVKLCVNVTQREIDVTNSFSALSNIIPLASRCFMRGEGRSTSGNLSGELKGFVLHTGGSFQYDMNGLC